MLTLAQATSVIDYLMNRGGLIALDTETTGLDIMCDRVLFWSMATEDRRWCFPVSLLHFFSPLFHRTDITWCFANAKYDMHILCNMGVEIHGHIWDIIVMDALEDDTRPHGLKEQTFNAYGARWGDFKDLFLNPYVVSNTLQLDKASYAAFKQLSVGDKLLFVYDENPDTVVQYASCDAYFTYMRAADLRNRLANEELPTDVVPGMKSLFDYFTVIEAPLTRELWKMEREGFLVDLDYVKKIDGPMKDGIAAAKRKIHKTAGKSFNPNSPDMLRDILFTSKGFDLTALRWTAGGASEPKESTDQKTLEILSERMEQGSPPHRFLAAILDYRHLVKLHGTYVKGIAAKCGPDGRIHSRLNQAGARTSRLSSANPNMQNVPSRNDIYKIRGCFISPPGQLLVDLDYPQIEFRIGAALAGETAMMDDIRRGWDIHSANAANMYADCIYEDVITARSKKDVKQFLDVRDKLMLKYRDGAKTAGLGAFYGIGPRKMANQLGISVDEAKDLISTFFDANQNIEGLIHFMHAYAKEYECTYTMLGRKRRLYRINSDMRGLVAAEERQAFNTLIQGSGAEMLKLAILRIGADQRFEDLGGKLILTVHDELIATAPKETAQAVYDVMKELMADPYQWGPISITYPVPVDPDGSIADRWSEAK